MSAKKKPTKTRAKAASASSSSPKRVKATRASAWGEPKRVRGVSLAKDEEE